MELLELKLNNFRNYQDLAVTFSPGVNVFLGPNAQGKTNLLEAIYVLALARSHRTTSDKELIGWEGKESTRAMRIIAAPPFSAIFLVFIVTRNRACGK